MSRGAGCQNRKRFILCMITENIWEYRSFKDQGLDITPQIHLGEKANAMERAGIKTIRGNINWEIIANNAIIMKLKSMYDQAKDNLQSVKAVPVMVVEKIENEILDMIRKMAERNKGRLNLPVVRGKYIAHCTDRASLQNKASMEGYVQRMGWTTFDEVRSYKKPGKQNYQDTEEVKTKLSDRILYLKDLLADYEQYKPYIKFNKEYWSLKGFAKRRYQSRHRTELWTYEHWRRHIKEKIVEDDKKIVPAKWRKELVQLEETRNRGIEC